MCMKKNSFMLSKITILESFLVHLKVFCGKKIKIKSELECSF